MVVGEGFEPSKSMTADLQSAPFGRSGTPPGVKSHCRLFSKMNGGGERITRRYLSSPFGAIACGNVLSLALESNLSRSFSSFPMGQNIEYRRIIGLRCFLRRWWWGKDYSALKRLALRAVACGNVLSLALESNLSRRFLPFPLSANIVYACRGNHITVVNNGGGGRIRTFEVDDGRFTVCSLWPLGNPTTG